MAPHAQPILDMVITDSRLADPVRPVFLTFAGEVEPGEPFAHMVENGPLLATLRRSCAAAGVRLDSRAVGHVDTGRRRVPRHLVRDGACLAALLVAAADGARSPLREAAGIQLGRLGLSAGGAGGDAGA